MKKTDWAEVGRYCFFVLFLLGLAALIFLARTIKFSGGSSFF